MIWMFSTPSMITCAVFLLSHVRPPHPVAVGILHMTLLQLRLPLLYAQILRHAQRLVIHLSLGLLLTGISDSLHRTVLVHETLQAIVPITVASPKIAHVSDSLLAIVQATNGDSLQGIPLLLSVNVHPVPPLMMPSLRDPHHGLLLPIPLLLPGKIGTLMIPPSLPPFGRWWTTFSRLFPSLRLLLPIRRRDPSICLPLQAWLMWRFPRVRFCLGPMLFLILSRRRSSDSPVVLRMGRLVTPFCLLSAGSKGYRIRPLRGRN